MRKFSMLAAFLATTLLSACTTEIGRREAFDASHENAMVVLGVRSNVGYYTLNFVQLNPANCQSNKFLPGKNFDHQSVFSVAAYKDQSKEHYILDTFKPGLWVLKGITYDVGTHVVNYDFQSIGFVAKPGDFIYIGDVTLGEKAITFEGHNRVAVDEMLKGYPNISASPTVYAPRKVSFDKAGSPSTCGEGAVFTSAPARNTKQDEWYGR